MLLAVSSFTSIVTELDAWRQVCNLAESIFVVIARPAILDAMVESSAETLEGNPASNRNIFFKPIDHAVLENLVCLDMLNPAPHKPPPRLAPVCRADRPRGPPALI